MNTPFRPVLTPCIGVCKLAANGCCDGCFRTGDEIARWSTMSDDERLRFMDQILPAREAAVAAAGG